MVKSTGRLNDYVRVVADLVNVGDGLPQKSDVKYHGVLVGMVNDVVPAANGKPNYVHIDLKPEYAKSIPAAVTARVVPSNVFAVSSVQLVGNGPGRTYPLQARTFAKTPGCRPCCSRPPSASCATCSPPPGAAATTGQWGSWPRSAPPPTIAASALLERRSTVESPSRSAQFDCQHRRRPLDGVRARSTRPRGYSQTAPDLLDALHQAVEPMQTFAETRGQLASLLSGADYTVGTTCQSFDNHIDQLIRITTDFTPVLGVLAMKSNNFVPAVTKLDNLANKFMERGLDAGERPRQHARDD